MSRDIRLSGLLMKQGYIRKSWKLRWFELYSDYTLRYFKSDSGQATQRGCVDLTECTAIYSGAELDAQWPDSYPPAKNRDCRFGLQVGQRTYLLVAPNPSDCNAWTAALRKLTPNLKIYKGRDVADARSVSAPPRAKDKYDLLKQALNQPQQAAES